MTIAFLGLGAMGVRMAARAVDAGHDVVTWNRTARTVEGARSMPSPRAAASAAELVLTMLTDVEACREVWLEPTVGALGGLREGGLAVDMSTVTPSWSQTLAGAVAGVGARFVAAPVVGTLPHAEQGILTILAGGATADIAAVTPALACLGTVKPIGTPERALALKLAINSLFAGQVALLAETLRLLETAGVETSQGLALLEKTPVFAPVLTGIAALIRAGDDAPRFPIDLVAKDLRYATQQAKLPLLRAVCGRYQDASAAGLGGLNLNAITTLYREPLSNAAAPDAAQSRAASGCVRSAVVG